MSVLINPYALSPVAPAATREYRALKSQQVNSSASAATISACDVGAAAADRYVFACLTSVHRNDRSLSSVTIGGVSARINVQRRYIYSGIENGTHLAAIVSAPLPAGTTADIAVTLSGSSGFILVSAATYRVLGLSSNVELDTDSRSSNSNASSSALGVDVQESGLLFDCAAAVKTSSSTPTFTYTGASKDVQSVLSAELALACGSHEVTADELARQVTLASTVAYRGARVLAAFR